MEAYIGEPYTSQVFFISAVGVPFTPTSPTITIFYYNLGTKVILVDSAPMVASTPAETGRYVYVYTFPGTMIEGTLAYTEIRGTDPSTGFLLYSDQTVNLIARSPGPRMTARFVR